MQSELRNHFSPRAFLDPLLTGLRAPLVDFPICLVLTSRITFSTLCYLHLRIYLSFIDQKYVEGREGMPCMPVYSLYLTPCVAHIRKLLVRGDPGKSPET